MAIEKIYGIYLNNLRWYQIKSLYATYIPEGKSSLKIERINELLKLWEELPNDDLINQYLFAGRVSVSWYRLLPDKPENSINAALTKIVAKYGDISIGARYPKLGDGFELIHILQKPGKLFCTFAMNGYRDHTVIESYELKSVPSEYFSTIVIRNSTPVLELRGNDALRGKLIEAITSEVAISLTRPKVQPISEAEFMAFKNAIPDSSIKKYKGRSINPKVLTEIFEMTAKQGIDYAQDTTKFEEMRQDMQDLSLTIIFDYDGSTFPLRLNLLTRSIYFPAFVSESAIDYIYEIFSRTLLEN